MDIVAGITLIIGYYLAGNKNFSHIGWAVSAIGNAFFLMWGAAPWFKGGDPMWGVCIISIFMIWVCVHNSHK